MTTDYDNEIADHLPYRPKVKKSKMTHTIPHVHRWVLIVSYDGNIQALCKSGTCVAYLTEEQIIERLNALEVPGAEVSEGAIRIATTLKETGNG